MQRKFITYSLLFFIPVLVIFLAVEWLTISIPSNFSVNKKYIEKSGNTIETLILGTSHVMNAANPAWMQSPTLNLASGNQFLDTDLKLYKSIHKKLPSLKNVVLEVSYSHFEIPPNGKDFWKNSLYYKFYDVNCFERTAYFKDKLIYLSNPAFFSERIEEFYINKKNIPALNAYGFNSNDSYGQFRAQDYNQMKIDTIKRFRINTEPNLKLFETNTSIFFVLLDSLKKEKRNIVICTTPMYKTFLQKRNPEILKRRDSIFNLIKRAYPSITILNAEADTNSYQLKHFWNHSHLNPSGAAIFTKQLDSVLRTFK